MRNEWNVDKIKSIMLYMKLCPELMESEIKGIQTLHLR